MWNFKNNKKEIESLEAQINELQSRNKELTTDRDYWKSEFEKLTKTCNPTDSDFAEKIRTWTATKMISNMRKVFELRKKENSINSIIEDRDLTMNLLEETITAKVECNFLGELGKIILQSDN